MYDSTGFEHLAGQVTLLCTLQVQVAWLIGCILFQKIYLNFRTELTNESVQDGKFMCDYFSQDLSKLQKFLYD